MPIKGITQETDNRLPLLGRIYKGDPKIDPKRPGKDLTYFRVEFSTEYAYLRPIWDRVYGDKCSRFDRIFLNGSTPDQAFSTWNEEHGSTKMIRRCDNEQQVKWFDETSGEYQTTPIPCIQESKVKGEAHCHCDFIGRLSIILSDLMAASGAVGYFLLSTHSIHDIRNLHGVIAFIHQQVSVRGIPLETVPFVFGRVERELEVPVPDKRDRSKMTRTKVKKSMLYLQADRDFASQLMIGSNVPQIASPDVQGIQSPQQDQPTQIDTNKPDVRHNDRADLGKVEAERKRVIFEIRDKYHLTPSDALAAIGANSFMGWTRPKFFEALDAVIAGDKPYAEDESENEPPDPRDPPEQENESIDNEDGWEF